MFIFLIIGCNKPVCCKRKGKCSKQGTVTELRIGNTWNDFESIGMPNIILNLMPINKK